MMVGSEILFVTLTTGILGYVTQNNKIIFTYIFRTIKASSGE